MTMSDAKRKANERHLQKLDSFQIRVPKGDKEKIEAFAAQKGLSRNAYILDLIRRDMDDSAGL